MSKGLGRRQWMLLEFLVEHSTLDEGLPVLVLLGLPEDSPFDPDHDKQDPEQVLTEATIYVASVLNKKHHPRRQANRRALWGLAERGLVEIWEEPVTFRVSDRPGDVVKVRYWTTFTRDGLDLVRARQRQGAEP